MMKLNLKKMICISCVILTLWICSCVDGGKSDLVAERDSIISVNKEQKRQLEELKLFVNIVSSSIDSIANEESMLFVSHDPERTLSKKEIKERIEVFAELIERQKLRITELEDSLKIKMRNKEDITKLQNIISYLNIQLEEKNREIEVLRNDLEKKKSNIKQLHSKVKVLKDTVVIMEEKTLVMDKVLSTQDAIINEGYFKIGTKKELEKAGIISGGNLFKKQKLNYENFSNDNFARIDIRDFSEIEINSKKPKILTPVAPGTYELISRGDKTILKILNPNAFWEVSNYLVIQL